MLCISIRRLILIWKVDKSTFHVVKFIYFPTKHRFSDERLKG
jgi:hypothetical protein